jgi:hypothetical protein
VVLITRPEGNVSVLPVGSNMLPLNVAKPVNELVEEQITPPFNVTAPVPVENVPDPVWLKALLFMMFKLFVLVVPVIFAPPVNVDVPDTDNVNPLIALIYTI